MEEMRDGLLYYSPGDGVQYERVEQIVPAKKAGTFT
jgi:hypothetical protein